MRRIIISVFSILLGITVGTLVLFTLFCIKKGLKPETSCMFNYIYNWQEKGLQTGCVYVIYDKDYDEYLWHIDKCGIDYGEYEVVGKTHGCNMYTGYLPQRLVTTYQCYSDLLYYKTIGLPDSLIKSFN